MIPIQNLVAVWRDPLDRFVWSVQSIADGSELSQFSFGNAGNLPVLGFWKEGEPIGPAIIVQNSPKVFSIVHPYIGRSRLLNGVTTLLGRGSNAALLVGGDFNRSGLTDVVIVRRGHNRRAYWRVTYDPFKFDLARGWEEFVFGRGGDTPFIFRSVRSRDSFAIFTPRGNKRAAVVQFCSGRCRYSRKIRIQPGIDSGGDAPFTIRTTKGTDLLVFATKSEFGETKVSFVSRRGRPEREITVPMYGDIISGYFRKGNRAESIAIVGDEKTVLIDLEVNADLPHMAGHFGLPLGTRERYFYNSFDTGAYPIIPAQSKEILISPTHGEGLGTVGFTPTFSVESETPMGTTIPALTPTERPTSTATPIPTVTATPTATPTATSTFTSTPTITPTPDTVAPSGFSVAFSNSSINSSNSSTVSVVISNGEIGATYSLVISDTDNGTADLTFTGVVNSNPENISLGSISSLKSGTLTASLTLTNNFANQSSAATATSTYDATPPVMTGVTIDASNYTTQQVTFQWLEATDDRTAQADLTYQPLWATTNAFSSVSSALAQGTSLAAPTTGLRLATVTGLAQGQTIYVSTVVSDSLGNRSLIPPVAVTTAVLSSGDGSSGTPYQINSVQQLNSIRHFPTSNFLVVADIDASVTGGWNLGLGWEPAQFTGSLAGNNKQSITGVKINRPNQDNVALLYGTGGGGSVSTVSRLVFDDATVVGRDAVGVVSANGVTATEVVVFGSVEGRDNVGALIGSGGTGTSQMILTEVTVKGRSNVGGLAGTLSAGTLRRALSLGGVECTGALCGGIVGNGTGVSNVRDVVVSGGVVGTDSVGGVVGVVGQQALVDSVVMKGTYLAVARMLVALLGD